MVLNRKTGEIKHAIFRDLPKFLESGDLLVFNRSRVIKARLFGRRKTGAKVEIFLLHPISNDARRWKVLVRPGRKALPGDEIELPEGVKVRVERWLPEGEREVAFSEVDDVVAYAEKHGQVPLPPYIKKELADPERYQTVYAETPGSVAAPTAGLHFTKELLKELERKGVKFAFVVLHVGVGTFRPIRAERVEDHRMHAEYAEVGEEVVEAIRRTKARGRRVVAVGTTVVRALETAALSGEIKPFRGWTDLFIYPGFKFRAVDAMITNFHLPRSSLIVLVSAFASREFIMRAYKEAIEKRYRFFSFGDAMLIL